MPSDLPGIDTTSTILTGSSDGYVRAVQILPTKLLGVVADHGDWPVERITVGGGTAELTIDVDYKNDDDEEEWHGIGNATGRTGGGAIASVDEDDNASASGGRWWVGSVGHEDGLRLTDLMSFFRDGEIAQTGVMGVENDSDVEDAFLETFGQEDDGISGIAVDGQEIEGEAKEHVQASAKRKRKQDKDAVETKKKRGKKNAVAVDDATFFGDL